MNNPRILLTVSNFLTALTGGLLLSTAVAALTSDPYFREHGRLAALMFGSAIAFLITNLASGWTFRAKASFPLLAVVADGMILALLQLAGADSTVALVSVFLLLWARWAFWFSSRSMRIGAAKSLNPALPVHYVEGAGFCGFAVGAVVPLTMRLLTDGAWKGPEVETVLVADIVLFALAALLDHAVGMHLTKPSIGASPGTRLDENYPVATVVALLVCLTLTTQMVLFAFNGSIGLFAAATRGDLGWELIVPAAYAGAALASLVGGLLGATLRLPGDILSPAVDRVCVRFSNGFAIPVTVLCCVAAASSLGAVLLAPQGVGSACLVLVALAANTMLSNSSLASIGKCCGPERLTKAVAAYFPLAILGFVSLSLSVTYAIPSMESVRWFLVSICGMGLLGAFIFSRAARRETRGMDLPSAAGIEA